MLAEELPLPLRAEALVKKREREIVVGPRWKRVAFPQPRRFQTSIDVVDGNASIRVSDGIGAEQVFGAGGVGSSLDWYQGLQFLYARGRRRATLRVREWIDDK